MLSSGQVSQMFAQQNQQFAGNAMYSQQISQQMPGMYPGGYGGGFSYGGGGGMGYDFASRTSGGAVSAMGGVAQFALGAGAVMGGLGMGGPLRMLDPFSGAGAMYRAGGAMGMGLGGRLAMGAAGMLPAMGLMAGASHVIGSVVGGAQQQAGIERVLGQNFNFVNPSSGGRGFSRQQSMAIGDMIRQLEGLPEMMTSVSELTRIMDKMGQMGVMNGATNVRDFGSKFKSTLGVLKEMSKVIGSTMEEALPLFGEIRRSGMYSTSDILKNAMQRQIVGGMTGMNQGQVGQVAAYGAQLGFATGGSRATGTQHALRMAGQLGMANQMGVLSNDKIMELTGMEGAEGLQALSGQLTQAGYRMSGGALGTAMSIAMAEQEGGKFTGKMDAALMERFRRGDISKGEMLRMVRQKTASRGAKMSYVANKGRLRSEMAGQMGVEGQLNMLNMVLGERGYDNPDALNIVSQGFGLDEREAGLLVELGQKMPDINLEMRSRGRAEAKRIAQQAFMKENYSWDALKTKVGKKIEGVITEPFKQFGADLRHTINNVVDDFVDEVTGKYKVEVTSGMSNLMKSAAAGLGGARGRLTSMLGGASAAMRSGVDMTPGTLGSMMNWMTGNTTAGERAVDAMRLINPGALEIVNNKDAALMQKHGYNRLDSSGYWKPEHTMVHGATMLEEGERLKNMIGGRFDAVASGRIAAVKGFGGTTGDLTRARQEMMYQGVFGRSGGFGGDMFTKLAGEANVAAAISQGGGVGAMYGRQRLQSYGAAADLLRSDPDRLKNLSRSISSFEKRGLVDIFGTEGAEEAKSAFKSLQGSQAGQVLANAYLTDFGAQESRLGAQAEGQLRELSKLAGQGNEGLGRDILSRGMGLAGKISGMSDLTSQAQDLIKGRGDDSNAEVLRRLAVKEIDGKDPLTPHEVALKATPAYQAAKDQFLIGHVANKGQMSEEERQQAGGWSAAEKAFLQKMGYDEKSFTPDVAKTFKKVSDLMAKAKMDPKAREELKGYLGNLQNSAIVEITQRFTEKGRAVSSSVGALRGSGLLKSDKEKAFLDRIQGYATKLSGGVESAMGGEKGTSFSQDMGSIAYDLTNSGLGDKSIQTLLGADDELAMAYGRASHVKRRLRQRKTSFSDYFDETKYAKLDAGDQERLKNIREKYFDSSGRVKDKEGFIKHMAGEEGGRALMAAGAEQRSAYASQAEIAQSMKDFVKSTSDLATIVQQMKGKEEKK